MKYNKLVRDRIPEIIEKRGGRAVIHIAEEAEYREKLHAKLLEEVEEFYTKPSVEEMADILEVIDALQELYNFDPEVVWQVQDQKYQERGGFEQRIILDES